MKLKKQKPIYKQWFLSYFLTSVAILFLFSSLYFYQLKLLPETPYAWLFIVLYTIGHFGILGFISYFPLLILTKYLWPSHLHRIIFPILNCLILSYVFVDSFVYSQYRFHINSMVFDFLLQGKGQILQFNRAMWFELGGIISLLLLTSFFTSEFILYKAQSDKLRARTAIPYFVFVFLTFITSHLIHALSDHRAYSPITVLATHYPLTAPARFDRDNSEQKKISQYNSNFYDIEIQNQNLICPNTLIKQNLLIILVDSLRGDILNSKVMPNTAQFAQDNLNFLEHFSGSNETRGGVFSLFYGLPPFFFEASRLKRIGPQLIDLLIKNHFEFGIYSSAHLLKPEFDQTLFSKIKNLRTESKAPSPFSRDIEITEEWENFLTQRNKEKPFFGFLFYDSLHAYDFPPQYPISFQPIWNGVNYFELNNNFNPEPFFNRYKTSAHFVDSLIKKVLASLEKSKVLDNTVIIITGDHGQEFNDTKKNYWGHNSNFSPYQTQTPLVIHWPNKKRKIFSHRTSHYDLTPTLNTHFFGCKNSDLSFGSDLFSPTDNKSILMGYSNKFGILFKNQIMTTEQFKSTEVVDFNYNKIDKANFNFNSFLEVLKKLSSMNHQFNKNNSNQ